jgi:hypothetical protein
MGHCDYWKQLMDDRAASEPELYQLDAHFTWICGSIDPTTTVTTAWEVRSLAACLVICLSACLSAWSCVCLPGHVSVCLPGHLICLPAWSSVCLPTPPATDYTADCTDGHATS